MVEKVHIFFNCNRNQNLPMVRVVHAQVHPCQEISMPWSLIDLRQVRHTFEWARVVNHSDYWQIFMIKCDTTRALGFPGCAQLCSQTHIVHSYSFVCTNVYYTSSSLKERRIGKYRGIPFFLGTSYLSMQINRKNLFLISCIEFWPHLHLVTWVREENILYRRVIYLMH